MPFAKQIKYCTVDFRPGVCWMLLETLGKGLDPNADASGTAGSVQWFIKQEVTEAGTGQNQGVGPKHTNKSKSVEAK